MAKGNMRSVTERMQHFFARAKKASGLKQVDIARHCGVSDTSVHEWLTGDSEPTHENLGKFCEAVGIDRSVFWGEIEDGSNGAAA